MNRQIIRLTYVALTLVGVLVAMTTYWQTWAAAGLADRQDNAVKRVADFSIDRGLIVAISAAAHPPIECPSTCGRPRPAASMNQR